MKRAVKILGLLVILLPLAFAGYVAYRLTPKQLVSPLPAGLLAVTSEDGQGLLDAADYTADYPSLYESWEPQELVSYCGVASGVIVLNALGESANQFNFFDDRTDAVRSRMQVTFGGMSLPELAGLLQARGLEARSVHGDEVTVEEFREVVRANLSTESDYLLVNYQRQGLGQGRVGHISPVGAYNSASDAVLIMDTADYKYPHTWVSLPDLYEAMQEKDSSSGRSRGFVEVRRP